MFKTELAALVQAHWGSGLDARHLPGSWSSTANANEGLAFLAKDAVLVVDDFAPGGSRVDVSRLHHDADRLFRAQGNRSGRGRMRVDASLRPPRPPRGLIVSTGEDVPRGASLGARMIVGEVGPDDVDVERLTACQADAAAGWYAGAMAGCVGWLASQGQAARLRLRQLPEGDGPTTPGHHRIARNLHALAAGVWAFLAFARNADALGVAEQERLWSRAVAAFLTLSRSQSAQQVAADPVGSFGELLGSALASGRAHVAGPDGQCPRGAGRMGLAAPDGRFRRRGVAAPGNPRRLGGRRRAVPRAAAAFGAAQAVGYSISTPIILTPRTLHQRLHEAGLLRTTESERSHLTMRQVLEGRRRYVLHLASSALHEPAQPAPRARRQRRGPFDGAGSPPTRAQPAHRTGRKRPRPSTFGSPVGQMGGAVLKRLTGRRSQVSRRGRLSQRGMRGADDDVDALMLLQQARLAGLHVTASGDTLVVQGPRRLEPIAQTLLAEKPQIMRALADEQEVAWRIDAMRPQATPRERSRCSWRDQRAVELWAVAAPAATRSAPTIGIAAGPASQPRWRSWTASRDPRRRSASVTGRGSGPTLTPRLVEILARMAEAALDAEDALATGGNIAGRRERVPPAGPEPRRAKEAAS